MFSSQYPLFGEGPVSVSLVKDVWGVYMGIGLQLLAIEFRAGSGASANDYFGKRASLVADAVDEEYQQLKNLMSALAATQHKSITEDVAGDFANAVSSAASGEHLFKKSYFYGVEFRTFDPGALFVLNLDYVAPLSLASDENIEFATSRLLDYAVLWGFVLTVEDLVESARDPVWGVLFRPSVVQGVSLSSNQN